MRHLSTLTRGRVLIREDTLAISSYIRIRDMRRDLTRFDLLHVLWRQVQRRGLGDGGWIQRAALGADAPFREYGRDDGEVILEFVEILLGRVTRLVQRIEEIGIMRSETELVDMVAEIERCVVQVLVTTGLEVAMPARRDVEVALDFVPLETPVYPACIDFLASLQFRSAGEFAFGAGFAHVREGMLDMCVFFLCLFAAEVVGAGCEGVEVLALGVGSVVTLVAACALVPGEIVCVFAGEEVAGQDAVHGRVLHVDVNVAAFHGDYNIEVEL